MFLCWQSRVKVIRFVGRADADLHRFWNELYKSVNPGIRHLTKNLRTSFLTTPRSALHFNVKTFTRVKNHHHTHTWWLVARLRQWGDSIRYGATGDAKGNEIGTSSAGGSKVADFYPEGTVGRHVNKLFQSLIDWDACWDWQSMVLYSAR